MTSPPPDGHPREKRRASGSDLVWLLAIAAGSCLVFLATELYFQSGELGFPLDDSWIHLQFARNLADGNGLSYNPGELVAGSTSPLWTALLAIGHWSPGAPAVAWAKVLGLLTFLGTVFCTQRIALELGLDRAGAALAAALVAVTDRLVWSALSGMEIDLFVFLSLAGILLHLRERRDLQRLPLALPVLGIASLARPEGVLLLGLAVADAVLVPAASDDELVLQRPPWRHLLVGVALAAVAVATLAVFHLAIGGSPLPTTFAAKVDSQRRWLPSGQYLFTALGVFFRSQPLPTLMAAAGIATLLERWGRRRDSGLLLALWVLALPLAYSLLSPLGRHQLVGTFGRYLFPLLPPIVILGVLGFQRAGAALGGGLRWGSAILPLRPLLVAALFAPCLFGLTREAARYSQNVANVGDGDVRIARWIRDNLPPDALIAVQDVGAIKYFAPNPILDLVGIVTPEIQSWMLPTRTQDDPWGEAGLLAFLEERRPEFLVLYPHWHERLIADPARFPPLLRLDVPGNITLADETILVYATPWSRRPAARGAEVVPAPG